MAFVGTSQVQGSDDHRSWLCWLLHCVGNRGVDSAEEEGAMRVTDVQRGTRVRARDEIGTVTQTASFGAWVAWDESETETFERYSYLELVELVNDVREGFGG